MQAPININQLDLFHIIVMIQSKVFLRIDNQ